MRFLLALLPVLLCCTGVWAQAFEVSVDVTDATCSANGRARVRLPADGSYSLQLENNCGDVFPPQSGTVFETLRPCTYRLTVRNLANGARVQSSFTVREAGEALSVGAGFDGCLATVTPGGGLGPYSITYRLQPDPSQDVFEPEVGPIRTSGALILGEIGDAKLTGRVTDACGNSRRITLHGSDTRLRRLQVGSIGRSDTVRFSVQVGAGPYQYTVSSAAGTFTNDSGLFDVDDLACDFEVTVAGACSNAPYTDTISLQGALSVSCVNFREGTVEIDVFRPSIKPYTFTVRIGDSTIVSSDTLIRGIPPGAREIVVRGEDACGRSLGDPIVINPLRLITSDEAETCRDTRFEVELGRLCQGPRFGPVDYTVISREDTLVLSGRSAYHPTSIFGAYPLGFYSITATDACGDYVACRDTQFLELTPACDSIIAQLAHEFSCDNDTRSRRPVLDTTLRYSLYDASGNVLETDNETGVFTNLAYGTYRVDMTGGCGNRSKTVILDAGEQIDPLIRVEPYYSTRGQDTICEFYYNVEILKAGGPFELTFLDEPDLSIVLNDFDVDVCKIYGIDIPLYPGEYRLASLSQCTEKTFTLPDLNLSFIDSISILQSCPGMGSIAIEGRVWSRNEWETYISSFGVQPFHDLPQNTVYYAQDQGSRDSLFNFLSPGTDWAYLRPYFAFGECRIDSVEFNIPEFEPLGLNVQGEYLCNATGTTILSIEATGGNGPYFIHRINCERPTERLVSYGSNLDTIIDIEVDAVGTYCFVVSDQCHVTADFQVEVRNLDDGLAYTYNCDETVTVSADTIAGTYAWFDAAGSFLGNGFSIDVPLPETDRRYELRVNTDICELTASIVVPPRPVTPQLTVPALEVVQCDADTAELSAATDTFSYLSWYRATPLDTFRQDSVSTIRVAEAGSYRVSAINDIGCRVTEEVVLRRSPRPQPTIAPQAPLCFGSTATLAVAADPADRVSWGTDRGTGPTLPAPDDDRYTVTVTNPDGCFGTDTFDLVYPPQLTLDPATDSVRCFGATDGRLFLNAAGGGTGPLTYSVSGGVENSLTDTLTELAAGPYLVTVRDGNGCTRRAAVEVGQPDEDFRFPLAADFDYDCTPAIVLKADTLNADYTWSDTAGVPIGATQTLRLPPAATDMTYWVTAFDGVCRYSGSIEVPARTIVPTISFDVPETTVCAGDSVRLRATSEAGTILSWSSAEGTVLGGQDPFVGRSGRYVVTAINDLNCRSTDSTLVRILPLPNPGILVPDDNCPGEPVLLTATASDEERVSWWPTADTSRTTYATGADWYVVTATNASGCSGTDSVYVVLPEPLVLDATADTTSCYGVTDARVSFSGSGGTGVLHYTFDGDSISAADTLDGIGAGFYRITVTDDHGCSEATRVEVVEPDEFFLELGEDRRLDFGETTDLALISNRDDFTLTRLPAGVDTFALQYGVTRYRPVETEILTVAAVDARGCPAADSIEIVVNRDLRLYPPTAFSPNGDGTNDAFTLMGDPDQIDRIEELRVFDRWGVLVFALEDAGINDLDRGWRGVNARGRDAASGVYVWYGTVRYFDGTVRSVNGSVTLVR